MSNLLQLDKIEKAFSCPNKTGHLVILDNIDFVLNKGEAVAIQGKSGSGKSTFLSIAALLEPPTVGRVLYHGEPCEKLSDKALAKLRSNSMGFVFQNSYLLEDFSALENVAFPLLIKGEKKAVAMAKAKELLAEVGLDERFEHRPSELSGGERQRVAISRAMIARPEIIFADEPTGALDEESASLIEDLLLSVTKTHGQALLLVTHNPLFAARCDKTYRLENKKLREMEVL
jgi:predicted ABC-type transport system involved in lysophospholipase L1 biosynthesis ATPase subunit